MAISPWRHGQTLPQGRFTLVDDSGAVAPGLASLSPSNFALIIHDKTGKQPDRTGAGAFTVTDATNGLVTYAWNTADAAQVGLYELYVQVTYPQGSASGAGVMKFGPQDWQVTP